MELALQIVLSLKQLAEINFDERIRLFSTVQLSTFAATLYNIYARSSTYIIKVEGGCKDHEVNKKCPGGGGN